MNVAEDRTVGIQGNLELFDGLIDEALACLRIGKNEQAALTASEAVRRIPWHARARLIHGVALARVGRLDRSVEELTVASRQSSGDAEIRYNLAVTLQQAGRIDSAMVEYAACLAIDPCCADALWNYGELLRIREHFAKAMECFERLEKLEGGRRRDKMAHRMAVCCSWLARDDEATTLFEEQIARDDEPVTHWEYAHYLLARGKFEDAWPHYARRFDAGSHIGLHRVALAYPWWTGHYESDSTLLVVGEQGAGDEILFAAFLPDLISRAKQVGMRIVVACRASLIRLFEASFPCAVLVAHEVAQPADFGGIQLSPRTFQVMFGDLPQFLKKPRPAAYLSPAPEDAIYMHELLRREEGLRVGLVWSSNPFSPQANRRQRNANTAILNAHLQALQHDHPDIHFFSLLDEPHRDALAQLADVRIVDMAAHLTDFSRTAALMNALDVVVTVCTASANLAGALGCDTRVLLQKHADWRWCSDTAWYPNAVTYRQKVMTDWSEPIVSVCRELNHLAAATSCPALENE
ncbi:tetratricopeptide repeat protein [Burkholderia sp. Ac-20345]|uniref:tetratricopeptide repeat protein n=1 Tax=Burkholderia sp. Ac-20345 TaxID=2703891 RepID=UPI00197BF027|nr:tetratricopeptide repeat protein [Burkholderia sp. Ac-20345]MBN3781041.1 tetratricopeptide repeat protein [Burkholderia sp. Ac-20345]